MTPATLSAEIDALTMRFHALNRQHWLQPGCCIPSMRYRKISDWREKRIGEITERIDRLQRFRSMLLAKEYALDRHDWISPQDLQISVASRD